MKRRCRSCRRFLNKDWHHNTCRKCRKLEKLDNSLKFASSVITLRQAGIIMKDQPKLMTVKEAQGQLKKVEPVPELEPEIYLGKKEMCGLCEEDAHLYNTKNFPKKICKECKEWVEVKLNGLPDGADKF